MHAVFVQVTINDRGPAEETLHEQVVPQVSQAPGFVTGHWTISQDASNGLSLLIVESEDAAQGLAQQIESNPPPTDAVTIENVEVREVVANA